MRASQYMGPHKTQLPHLIGIFLLSLATLLLELALTRVLSVTLWYHFGFLVISTALLGFGVSGVILALWTRLRENDDLDGCLSLCSLAFSGTTFVAFWLMQHVPFDPFSIAVDRRQWIIMPAYFLLVAVPFFCSGLAISLLLTRTSRDVARLYACDLLGAGAGCALVTVLLPRLGGSGSVLAAASLGSFASLCFALRSRRLLVASSALVAFALALAGTQADRLLPVHISANKLTRPLHPIYTAWNTLSRVDVEESPAQGARPAERRMIIDAGTAATGLQDLRPRVRDILQKHPETIDDPSSIVYIAHPAARVLIIGSGGGAQVLEALRQDSPSITAVEINPTINDIVAHRMDDFWGGLFHQPEVHLVTDEGRSFLRRSPDRYDAIISVHTISNAAVASGALSLAENYVLTREAFDDYLDHLAPGGIIFFTRPEAQIARLVATARESFAARHLGSIENNVFAYTQRSTNSRTLSGRVQDGDRASFSAGFLLQNRPFTSTQLSQVRQKLTAQSKAENGETKVLYAPDAPREPPLSLYQGIVSAPDLQAIYNTNDTQLAPATDDKPFFNQHTRWSRIRWSTFVDTFSQNQARGARMALEDRPVAELTLIILLLQSVGVALICILVPLTVFHRRPLGRNRPVAWLVYFAALGFGYIMVEIALLQRFLLFLGQPIYTYAVVLAGLLIFTGVGSWAAGRVPDTRLNYPNRALLLALATVVALSFLTGPVFQLALGLPLPIRIAVSLVLVGPLGFALGQPFPLGLRMATAADSSLGAWAWGVNGFFTVIGTILALMLGMIFGFRIVLLLSGSCYVIAMFAMWQLTRSPVSLSTSAESVTVIG